MVGALKILKIVKKHNIKTKIITYFRLTTKAAKPYQANICFVALRIITQRAYDGSSFLFRCTVSTEQHIRIKIK
jgi:hypothetical protein